MCNVPALMIGSAVVSGIGKIHQHREEAREAREERQAARSALAFTLDDLEARGAEEVLASAVEARDVRRQQRAASATATASAAEAGVGGISVDLLLGDLERQRGEAVSTIEANRDSRLRQIEREKRGARFEAQSRINRARGPSLFTTGLSIAGDAVGTGIQLRNRRAQNLLRLGG